MRKILAIMLAFALVSGFAMNASADTCTGCKGNIGKVDLPTTKEQTDCSTAAFDYDGYWVNSQGLTTATDPVGAGVATNRMAQSEQFGYCKDQGGKFKLIFKVCECGTANIAGNMRANQVVGIQMDILTDGVYWSGTNRNRPTGAIVDSTLGPLPNNELTELPLGRFSTETAACNALYYNEYTARFPYSGTAGDKFSGDALQVHVDADGVATAEPGERLNYLTAERANMTPPLPWAPNSQSKLGIVRYYKDAACAANEGRAPYDGQACTIPDQYKSKSLQSIPSAGYKVQTYDETYNVSYWWINVPPMRLNVGEAKRGDTVQLKVSLLGQRAGTICASCIPFCSCVIDIATIGCEGRGDLFFPYVLQQAGDWKTGVAIANLSFAATINPTVSFTLVDSTGTAFKGSTPMSQAVWAWNLDDLISGANALTWTSTPAGRTVTPGFAYLCISSNFSMDGYSFVQDGNFGGSVLPRQDVTCQ